MNPSPEPHDRIDLMVTISVECQKKAKFSISRTEFEACGGDLSSIQQVKDFVRFDPDVEEICDSLNARGEVVPMTEFVDIEKVEVIS